MSNVRKAKDFDNDYVMVTDSQERIEYWRDGFMTYADYEEYHTLMVLVGNAEVLEVWGCSTRQLTIYNDTLFTQLGYNQGGIPKAIHGELPPPQRWAFTYGMQGYLPAYMQVFSDWQSMAESLDSYVSDFLWADYLLDGDRLDTIYREYGDFTEYLVKEYPLTNYPLGYEFELHPESADSDNNLWQLSVYTLSEREFMEAIENGVNDSY
jgi:hypothetical protein